MSQMKEQEMAKEKESGSKPPLTPEESERLNQSVQKSEAQAVAQLRHQRKVRILIPSGRGEHEKCPVTLGVNGRKRWSTPLNLPWRSSLWSTWTR